MTTLQMQHMSQFGTPVAEDLMELTSDMDRRLGADEDNDIDIDITGGIQQDREDEYMEENVEESLDHAPPVEQDMREASDDGMVDESYAASITEQASIRDEDIEDADCTGLYVDEDTIVETTLEHISDPSQNLKIQNKVPSTQDHDHEYPTPQTTANADSAFTTEPLFGDQNELMATNHEVLELVTQEFSQDQKEETDLKEGSAHDQTQNAPNMTSPSLGNELEQLGHDQDLPTKSTKQFVGAHNDEEVTSLQSEGNEEFAARFEEVPIALLTGEEGYPTAQDDFPPKTLPPILVGYQGNEFYLFPPVGQDVEHPKTFFLDDECHADETIKYLLGALRSVLDQNIDEHDELVISVVDLSLDISEVCLFSPVTGLLADRLQSTPESSSTTLRQLVDVYSHLQMNDELEIPPQFFINLTSKPRFAYRLAYLRNAIVEGKGLLQTQSSKVAESGQQDDTGDNLENEHGDDAHLIEFAQTPQIEAHEQNGGKDQRFAGDDSQSNSPLFSRPLQASEPYDITNDSQNQDKADAIAQLDTNKSEVEATAADKDVSEVALTGNVSTAPSTLSAGDDQRQVPDEPAMDDGDFVDYEDNEHSAQGTSSGSSTLRGDVLEVAPERDLSELLRPIAHISELQGDEARSDFVNGQNITADADTRYGGSSDVGEVDLEYPDYPNEDDASSSDGNFEEGQDYIEDDLDSADANNPGKDDVELAEENHNATLGQRDEDTVTFAVEIPQEQENQDLQDCNSGLDGKSDINSEEQGPSSPIEDEYDFGHASPQEEQTALDDLSKEDQPVEDRMRPLDAVDDTIAKATLETPVLDTAVKQDRQDDDEITYEDEDNEESPQEPTNSERNMNSSPGSLKRVRSLDEDGGAYGDDLQGELLPYKTRILDDGVLIAFPVGAKRVRSG